jgi:hypothetical protein
MLDDLELAAEALRAAESMDSYYECEREGEWIDTFRDLIRDETRHRQILGDSLYEAHRTMVRWSAQRALLGRSGVDIPILAWMYGLPRGIATGFDKNQWASLVGESKLLLQVGELPISFGGSSVFREKVADEIAAFKTRWDWIISPLVVASHLKSRFGQIRRPRRRFCTTSTTSVRDYLIPGIVPAFGTVSDHRWTMDFDELRARDPKLADRWGPNPTPPVGRGTGSRDTRSGACLLSRKSRALVSAALVADMDAKGDLMGQMDDCIRDWRENLTDDRRHPWRRRRRR